MSDGGGMHVDYAGQQGGLMAMAFAAGATFAAGALMAVAKFIYDNFLKKRISELEATIAENNQRCKEENDRLQTRIMQLETMLQMHGPQPLRQAIQAALSETQAQVREIAPGAVKISGGAE